MKGSTELWNEAKDHGCAVFPLGAGGGGAVFVFAKDSADMANLRDDIGGKFFEISYKIRDKRHELLNLDDFQIS